MARKSPDPSKVVDAFLAAPETVLRSETERKRLLQRKAREAAEAAQNKDSKRKTPPSIEEMLEDLVRVAEDRDTNPFWKFRTLSAKRYRLYGHFPIERVFERFGTFEHAKQVANLEDRAGTRLKKQARANADRAEHTSRYLERWVLPYVVDQPKKIRGGTKLVLSISDTHATFLDPFVWHVFLSACRDLQPDIVYFNGDILEGAEISRHPKIPGWTVPLQLELDFAREMFRQTRLVVPSSTELVWGAGNHGLDRLASYLTQVAPAFSGLRSMRFDKLAGLDDLNVKLAMGGTIASPRGTEDNSPGMLLYGFYRIHHGTYTGAGPGARELAAAGRSGQSGHVHTASLSYRTRSLGKTDSWMTTPMGCTNKAGRAYMKGIATGWQTGFGVAFLSGDEDVRQYPVVCDDGFAVVEGRVYRRPANLPEQDVTKLWLTDLKVPR